MTNLPGIEVRELSKTFGNTVAVDGLSFTAEPGRLTCFLGPNGAGKTTTLRIILGLVEPTTGSATIAGRRYAQLARPTDTVGAALEASSFHPARSGRNHLRVYCAVNGYPEARADEVLELVGLTGAARRPVRGYSLGMRQRLGLAAALLGDPHVLVLDEPSNGLDPSGIAWLRGFLRQLAAEGRTVLVSSHALSEVQQIADHVVIINEGRLVRAGRLEALSDGQDRRVLVRSPDARRLATALSGTDTAVEWVDVDTVSVTGLTSQAIGRLAFDQHVELHALETQPDDLERIYFALTGEEEAPR